jgi:hypothetical protein
MTTEQIAFYPHNYEQIWPGIDAKIAAPYVMLNVNYLDNGCMILDSVNIYKREMMLMSEQGFRILLDEITSYVSRYNTAEIC